MSGPYEWLWRRIGGRPWTHIIRDSWHSRPLLWILGLVSVATGSGIILGHLFW